MHEGDVEGGILFVTFPVPWFDLGHCGQTRSLQNILLGVPGTLRC